MPSAARWQPRGGTRDSGRRVDPLSIERPRLQKRTATALSGYHSSYPFSRRFILKIRHLGANGFPQDAVAKTVEKDLPHTEGRSGEAFPGVCTTLEPRSAALCSMHGASWVVLSEG